MHCIECRKGKEFLPPECLIYRIKPGTYFAMSNPIKSFTFSKHSSFHGAPGSYLCTPEVAPPARPFGWVEKWVIWRQSTRNYMSGLCARTLTTSRTQSWLNSHTLISAYACWQRVGTTTKENVVCVKEAAVLELRKQFLKTFFYLWEARIEERASKSL